jgi:hypothetical protein
MTTPRGRSARGRRDRSALSFTLRSMNRPLRLRNTESEAISAAPNQSPVAELARRTVFADTITLPDGWHT